MTEVKTLISKHVSPTTILAELQDALPEIEEVYVVYKRKGKWFESLAGDLQGMSFAVMILHNYIINQFSIQERGE
jgi:hypothetical protein